MKQIFLCFFLVQIFLNQRQCREEWKYAKQLADEGKPIFRIPILLRDCPWEDFLKNDDVKGLPDDMNPVASFDQEDTAWKQVYNGIKEITKKLRKTFKPKSEFVSKMEKNRFFFRRTDVKLQDIFIFPTLLYYVPSSNEEKLRIRKIKDQKELISKGIRPDSWRREEREDCSRTIYFSFSS